jgi:hypothetical protein
MNETKWDELRLAMHGLGELRPRWRTLDISGFVSEWDGDWYYHFRAEGYGTIEFDEIQNLSPEQDAAVLAMLRQIHLPGTKIADGYCIYGYSSNDVAVNGL